MIKKITLVTLLWIISLMITWKVYTPNSDKSEFLRSSDFKSAQVRKSAQNPGYIQRIKKTSENKYDLNDNKHHPGRVSFMLKEKSKEEIIQFTKDIVSDENKVDRFWAMRRAEAFCALGRKDPILALDLYSSLRLQYDFDYITEEQDEILSYLAEKDLPEALKYLQGNGAIFHSAHDDIFKKLAKKNLTNTLEKLDKIDFAYSKFGAIRGISSTFKKPEEYLEFLNHLAIKQELPKKFIQPVIREWTSKNPIDALAWAESFYEKGELNEMFESHLLYLGIQVDAKGTADWGYRMSEDKSIYYDLVVYEYTTSQNEDLEKWFFEQPPSDAKDTSILRSFWKIGNLSNQQQEKLYSTIKSLNKRKKFAHKIYKNNIFQDAKFAENFLHNNKDLTETEKENLRDSTLKDL